MQYHAVTVAIIGLIGVLLGGGVRAAEAWYSRRMDAAALLSALAAEVAMLCRLVEHRNFLPSMYAYMNEAQAMIDNGHGEESAPIFVMSMKSNYFAVHEANLDKIGLLNPYFVDRITRFYAYLKAASENYYADAPAQTALTARDAVAMYESDIGLLDTALQIGRTIAEHRSVKVPRGITDPFLSNSTKETE